MAPPRKIGPSCGTDALHMRPPESIAMKTAVSSTVATAAAVAVLAYGNVANAHSQSGSLGTAAAATDYYQVSCTDDGSGPPASLVAQVQSLSSSGSPVPAVVVHRRNIASSSTDLVGGDAGASPLVAVNADDGVYNVFVIKSAAGSVNYTLTYHCMTGPNGTGLHTGTTLVTQQNE